LNTGCISADLFNRRRQLRPTAPCYKDGGAFVHKLPCGRETDTAVPSGYQGDLSLKLCHPNLFGFGQTNLSPRSSSRFSFRQALTVAHHGGPHHKLLVSFELHVYAPISVALANTQ
jgi:hypothetical protein